MSPLAWPAGNARRWTTCPHGATIPDSEDIEGTFYRYLGDIEDHHSEHAAPRRWDAIHVIGLSPESVRPERIAEELGADSVALENEPDGFMIHRAAPSASVPNAQRIEELTAELDRLVPREDAFVRFEVYGGGLDECYMIGNASGGLPGTPPSRPPAQWCTPGASCPVCSTQRA